MYLLHQSVVGPSCSQSTQPLLPTVVALLPPQYETQNPLFRSGLQLPLEAHTSASDSALVDTVHYKVFYLFTYLLTYLLLLKISCGLWLQKL